MLIRQPMAGLLQAEGFMRCPEQQRLAELLRGVVAGHGSQDVDADSPMLRSVLMGAVYAMVLPNVPMPVALLRAELFKRYELDREMGGSPEAGAAQPADLSRYFATGYEPAARTP